MYIPAVKSWACYFTVPDVLTCRWVGYALNTSATAVMAVEALLDAMNRHHDADPTSLQYTAVMEVSILSRNSIRPSGS